VRQHHQHHQHRVENQFHIDNQFNGDVDGRNFDELYGQQPQMNASYQTMNVYGRNPSMYHQNYQHAYPATAGYYSNSSSAASIPSSYDASYPASSQSYGVAGNNAYYDHYASQYNSQYGNQSFRPPYMVGQMGYYNNPGYYAEGGNLSAQSVNSGESGYESYPQAYPAEGDYQDADHYE